MREKLNEIGQNPKLLLSPITNCLLPLEISETTISGNDGETKWNKCFLALMAT